MEIKILTNHDEVLWEKVAKYAESCSWQTTGRYLSNLMKNNGLSDWERVFAAYNSDNDSVAGFCALTKTSTVFHGKYTPYIGFVFVGEPYRGSRISKNLCLTAIKCAKTAGFDRVFLYSDLSNFYEKYGFTKIDEAEAPWGAMLSIYMHCT